MLTSREIISSLVVMFPWDLNAKREKVATIITLAPIRWFCVDVPSKRVYGEKGSMYNVEIYSPETGNWEKSIMKSKIRFDMQSHSVSKVIGGVFHWHHFFLDWLVAYDPDNARKGQVVVIELPIENEFVKPCGKIKKQIEVTKDWYLQFIRIKGMFIKEWILKSSTNYMDEDLILADKWSLASNASLWNIGFGCIHEVEERRKRIMGADPVDPQTIYMFMREHLFAYNCREKKIVFAYSQEIAIEADEFLLFEWPTWPCLL